MGHEFLGGCHPADSPFTGSEIVRGVAGLIRPKCVLTDLKCSWPKCVLADLKCFLLCEMLALNYWAPVCPSGCVD